MKGEGYTSRKRIEKVIGSGVPDRVPVLTYSNHFQIRWAGYNYGEVMREGEKFVEAQLSALDHFGYDGVTSLGGPGMVADALGAELLVPEDESPSMTEPGLTAKRDKIDLEGLYARRIENGKHLQFSLQVTEHLRKELNPRVPLIAAISSPFREASLLRGFERLFLDLAREPSFTEGLIDLMADRVYDFARMAVEAGADLLGFTDPFASQTMISRSRFRSSVYPYEKKLIERIHDTTGAKVLFHTCGQWGDRFDLAVKTGADIYHIDGVGEANLSEITKRYGDSVAIMGRLPTTGLLLREDPEEVLQVARNSIESVDNGGNYILAGNCSLAPDTPPANLNAMVEAAKAADAFTGEDNIGQNSSEEEYSL